MRPFDWGGVSRLLILSCSERKNLSASPLPAIQRYDGPFFRVARRGLADAPETAVFVLSARFGLVHGDAEIPWYDQPLTKARRTELRDQIAPGLSSLANADRFDSAFICAGRKYLHLIDPHLPDLRAAFPVMLASGGLGEKLTRLRGWLGAPRPAVAAEGPQGTATVRGVRITATRDEVLAMAERAVRSGDRAALKCHGWYVPATDGRVAPKWLIQQLSRLPVSRFHSDDARRALAVLGVPVLPCA
jgi:hypothetical protein